MKAKHLDPPRFLTFSGTGSKVINIPDGSLGLQGLQRLTVLIFQEVFKGVEIIVDLKQPADPKEITCRGGLLTEAGFQIEDIKTVLLGDSDNTIIPEKRITYDDIKDEKILKDVVEEVKSFIDFLFNLNKDNKIDFHRKFGINVSNIEVYRTILKEDLMRFLKSGIDLKKEDLQGKSNINVEEPLFFYPLVGAVNNLACKIVTQTK